MKNVIWVIIAIVAIGWFVGSGKKSSTPGTVSGVTTTSSDPDVSNITVLSERIVREHLKAPSTAKFPGYPEVRWDSATRRASAIGKVDAQNAFGAMLRQEYILIMRTSCYGSFHSRDCWTVEGLTLGDQILINRLPAKPTGPSASRSHSLTREQLADLQRALTRQGYAPGPADGVWGSKTADAIAAWRLAKGVSQSAPVDAGFLTMVTTAR